MMSLLTRITEAEANLTEARSILDEARLHVEQAEQVLGDLMYVPDHV